MSFIAHQCNALTPIIIYFISEYIESGQFQMQKSIMLLFLIFGLKIIKTFLTMHAEYNLKKIGGQFFSCLCYSLTSKSLKKINFAKGEPTISEISKLAQYDCSKVIEYPSILSDAVFELYSFIFTMMCLFYVANWEGLVSCVVLLVLQMIRYIMMGVFKKYQKKVNEEASKRIKKSTETINNMKFIKVNALENLFFNKLNDLRSSEVSFLQKFLNLGIITTVMQYGASRISIVVFILLYSLNGHQLTSALIFSVLLFYHYMAL
jgi:ABC-type multidrug transport system fused ATPase/permease subunit